MTQDITRYPKMPFNHGMLLNSKDAQVIRKGIYRAKYTVTCGNRADYYGHYIKLEKDRIYMATGNTTEPLFVLDEDEKCWRKASFIPADTGCCLCLEEDCYNEFYRQTEKLEGTTISQSSKGETITARELLNKLKALSNEQLDKPIFFYTPESEIYGITYIDLDISDRIDLA